MPAKIHQGSGSGTYVSWLNIRRRCLGNHPNYSGRGIKMCSRWAYGENGLHGFQCFLADMGPRPPGMSIERIDNDGDYTPENCKWATTFEQSLNRRNTVYITHDGIQLPARIWAEITGIKNSAIYNRVKQLGWDTTRAFTTPVKHYATKQATI
jgi:hypothetical protein